MAANPIYQYELYFLHQKSGAGWREQIAAQVNTTPQFDVGLTWAQQRRTFLAGDCLIIGYSRRRIDGVKDSVSFLFDTPVQGTFGNADSTGAGKTNEPANTIEYEVYSLNRANRRCFYFRGIDDSWISAGSITAFGDANLQLVEAYLTWLKNNQCAIRTQGNPWIGCVTVANKTTTIGSPIVVNAIGLNPPTSGNLTIYLKGMRGYPYLNGRWIGYYGGDANTVVLGQTSGRYAVQLAGTGYARLAAVGVQQINSWFFARCGNRKTGLPFGVTRGKKSKKVIHQG